jgi:hypothetical protein
MRDDDMWASTMRVDLYLLQVCIQTNPFLLFVGVITLANLKGKSIVPFLELEPDVLSTQKTPKNLV